jgi:hypothetical protein
MAAMAIGAGATGYFVLQRSGDRASHPTPAAHNRPSPPSSRNPARPDQVNARAEPRAGMAYRKAFIESTDYNDFVRNAYPAAKAGNSEAQFYISEALGYCEEIYRRYFHKPAPDLPVPSLEEQIGKFQAHMRYHIPIMRAAYTRCHDLMENDVAQWGTREEWLAKATDAALPAAEARTASLLLDDKVLNRPSSIKSRQQDPVALLRNALDTKDPTALMVAASFTATVDDINYPGVFEDARVRDQRVEKNRLAWWLLACESGYDCGTDGPWFVSICAIDRRCQPGTDAVDYIRQSAQDLHIYDIDRLAAELNAKVDAKAWSELGLGGG